MAIVIGRYESAEWRSEMTEVKEQSATLKKKEKKINSKRTERNKIRSHKE